MKLDLHVNDSVPISDRFFDKVYEFKAIEKFRIDLKHNTVLSGSVECFKHCKQLNDIDIYYSELKEDFLTNIEAFVSKLKSLVIQTKQEFSDSFIQKLRTVSTYFFYQPNILNTLLLKIQ